MTTSKSHFEQLSSKTFAKIIRKYVYIVSNQDQIKINLSVTILVALTFMCSIIKILHLKYCPVCNV